MNLVPIYPTKPEFSFKCTGCTRIGNSETGAADLDGAPFKSYYCRRCADLEHKPGVWHKKLIEKERKERPDLFRQA